MNPSRLVSVVTVFVLAGTSVYVLWAYEYGQPPFCSGYPPGGNCPGNISYTFRISVNYTGPWQATYYGYHVVWQPSKPYAGAEHYTKGDFVGTGFGGKNVTLSGPNTTGVTLCVQAQKLDSSSSVMTLSIEPRVNSNSTSLPMGITNLCVSVVP
jgi:hypothetical protein